MILVEFGCAWGRRGVVHNTVHNDWSSPPEEEAYLPMLQHRDYLESQAPQYSYLSVVVRAQCAQHRSCAAASLAPPVRAVVRGLNPNIPIADVKTMAEWVAEASARERFYVLLLTAFAFSALVLAAVGIYGVMSDAVARGAARVDSLSALRDA